MKKALAFSILILIAFSCRVSKQTGKATTENEKLQNEIIANNKLEMKNKIATFLTFQENNAEEAMNFYVEIFENSEIVEIKRYGKD